MKREDIKRLQNHFDAGIKDGYQAKVHYSVGNRVHLKGTKINGVITGVIFKNDRTYPYLKIKWDIPVNDGKKYYDPFDVVKEVNSDKKTVRQKKVYRNFYLEECNNVND